LPIEKRVPSHIKQELQTIIRYLHILLPKHLHFINPISITFTNSKEELEVAIIDSQLVTILNLP